VIRDGMTVTSATRTILDAAETGTPSEQIEMATIQAIERGLATAQQLRRDASERGGRVAKLIANALHKVEQ
jgi:hypothetical protein